MRAPSAIPPARPAAAAVPTIAGPLALWAAVPTESPTFPTVDPTVLPTPLSVPATPLVVALDFELRDRALRAVPRLAVDAERGRLLDAFLAVLRVPADDLVLRLELRALEALRLVACAILHPSL